MTKIADAGRVSCRATTLSCHYENPSCCASTGCCLSWREHRLLHEHAVVVQLHGHSHYQEAVVKRQPSPEKMRVEKG